MWYDVTHFNYMRIIMSNNTSVMRFLDSMITDDYKKYVKLNKNEEISFLVKDSDVLSQTKILSKKLQTINKIQNLAKNNNKDLQSFFGGFIYSSWRLGRLSESLICDLKKSLADPNKQLNDIDKQRIADLLVISAIQEIINTNRSAQMINAQITLEQILYEKTGVFNEDFYLTLLDKVNKKKSSFSLEPYVLEYTGILNVGFRLFVLRANRILNYLVMVLGSYYTYVEGFRAFQSAGWSPFLSFLSWVYFLPRMYYIFCRVLGAFFANGKSLYAQSIGWFARLKLVLLEFWPTIFNDLMWCGNGILTCFFLAGIAVPFIGIYLVIATQVCDFLINLFNSRLDKNSSDRFENCFKAANLDDKSGECDSTLELLRYRFEFERNRAFYTMINFTGLMVCAAFFMPAFLSISPIIPLVASIIAVLITLYNLNNLFYFRSEFPKKFGLGAIPAVNVGLRFVDDISKIKDHSTPLGAYKKGIIVERGKIKEDEVTVNLYENGEYKELKIRRIKFDQFSEIDSNSKRIEPLPLRTYDNLKNQLLVDKPKISQTKSSFFSSSLSTMDAAA